MYRVLQNPLHPVSDGILAFDLVLHKPTGNIVMNTVEIIGLLLSQTNKETLQPHRSSLVALRLASL